MQSKVYFQLSYWQWFLWHIEPGKISCRYLKPIEQNPERERAIASDLKTLRNNVCFAFFMLNALWITIIYMLEVSLLRKAWNFYVWNISNISDQLRLLFGPSRDLEGWMKRNTQFEPDLTFRLKVFRARRWCSRFDEAKMGPWHWPARTPPD